MKAILYDTIIAESDETIIVEGNHYFPKDSLKMEFLKDSDTSTTCPWKGEASYYHASINGNQYDDVAWYYQNPSELAENIKDKVAFWKDVQIVDN